MLTFHRVYVYDKINDVYVKWIDCKNKKEVKKVIEGIRAGIWLMASGAERDEFYRRYSIVSKEIDFLDRWSRRY